MRQVWWLHSFWALAFGVGVMLFARQGLEYADKVLVVLAASWLLVFVAFRFVVGAQNRAPDERMVKRGVRLLTNYVIKQLYQQMFFFLVPLYASSATWSLSAYNWWIVPLLLLCAVLSTMDLVFDNFIMEHRAVAGAMYGFCLFAVLNLILPLVFALTHFDALLIAAAATAPTVALLSFRLAAVFSLRGIAAVLACSVGLTLACFYGRIAVPPAPLSAVVAIGHGRPGEFECVPGPKRTLRADRLEKLRCVSELSMPGGAREQIIHLWERDGRELARITPAPLPGCPGARISAPRRTKLPATGRLSCVVLTERGQMAGRADLQVVRAAAPPSAAR